jgi:hypothetical protein
LYITSKFQYILWLHCVWMTFRYLSREEALQNGGPGLNPPQAPAGYKFAGWAPPPDGTNHDGR